MVVFWIIVACALALLIGLWSVTHSIMLSLIIMLAVALVAGAGIYLGSRWLNGYMARKWPGFRVQESVRTIRVAQDRDRREKSILREVDFGPAWERAVAAARSQLADLEVRQQALKRVSGTSRDELAGPLPEGMCELNGTVAPTNGHETPKVRLPRGSRRRERLGRRLATEIAEAERYLAAVLAAKQEYETTEAHEPA